jgi:hypothetical protein
MAEAAKRYCLLTGQFYLRFEERRQNEQPQPDGDTVRFVPDNPYALFDSSKIKRYGSVGPDLDNYGINVRLEGIDALETHFTHSGSPVTHQNAALGQTARDLVLDALGFTEVVFDETFPLTVRSVRENHVRGYVIANGVEQNGRLLGFVYAGTPDGIPDYDDWKRRHPDPVGPTSRPVLPGAVPIFLRSELMERSVNWQLLDAGLAYAELYTSMPLDLLRHMANRVRRLRMDPPANSIWSSERESLAVGRSFAWDKTIASMQDSVMFPKIFRRLVAYSQFISSSSSNRRKGFESWLRDKQFARDRDDRLLLPPRPDNTDPPNCEFGNLHDIIEVAAGESPSSIRITLRNHPEDVVVLPDNV